MNSRGQGVDNVQQQRLGEGPPGEADVDTGSATSTAGQQAQPGGTAVVQRTMTATITALDKSASSISFAGPNGWKPAPPLYCLTKTAACDNAQRMREGEKCSCPGTSRLGLVRKYEDR